MNKWLALGCLFTGLLSPNLTVASAIMTLKGTVFSVMREEFVLQVGNELYYIKKDGLGSDQREQFEKASTHEITVDVPMTAITRVRNPKEDQKKPASGK
jgi:hypothetical protein